MAFWQIFSSQGGFLCVAVFFFLSGYGLMESEQKRHLSPSEFIYKRLKRVVFPLIVLAVLWIPLYYGFDLAYPASNDSLWNVITRTLNIGGWFVSAILMMYLVFMLFSWMLTFSKPSYAMISLCCATFIAYFAADKLLGYYCPISIPIFTTGILASYYKDKTHLKWFNHSLIYLIASLFVVVGYSIYIQNQVSGYSLAVHAIINYIAIALLIVIFTNFSPRIAFPVLLGEISFDIYLIHKKIITANYSLSGDLIELWTWVALTILFTFSFVLLRKTLWNLISNKTKITLWKY